MSAIAIVGLLAAAGCARHAAANQPGAVSPVAQRIDDSAAVFNEIMATPDKAIPQNLVDGAQCVAIVPGLKKGAFIVGAKYGRGFISCRNKNGVGWTAPGAVTVGGGSFGLQIGGEETDVIMLVMNKSAEDRLLSSQFTLGADASVAAGPVGRTAEAGTDIALTAQILTYSRSRGVFAGVALNGATLKSDSETNQLLYGKPLDNKQVIEGQVRTPAQARPLISALDKYSPRASGRRAGV